MQDLEFLQGKTPGTQQVRLMIGHALFGARVEYGEPLFFTISPSSRHSGLCIRLTRYRECDPVLQTWSAADPDLRPWHKRQQPRLWASKAQKPGDASVELPEYDLRALLLARDPWAVVSAFKASIKYILAPRCNCHEEACQNIFGNGFTAAGGVFGLVAGFGGSVEYQRNSNPHFHGNMHIVSVYQHKTLFEIKDMLEKELLSADALLGFQAWAHREEHFAHAEHQEQVPAVEAGWQSNFRGVEHAGLCSFPEFISQDDSRTMWDEDRAGEEAARADAKRLHGGRAVCLLQMPPPHPLERPTHRRATAFGRLSFSQGAPKVQGRLSNDEAADLGPQNHLPRKRTAAWLAHLRPSECSRLHPGATGV